MRLLLIVDVEDIDLLDPDHEMGVTEEGYLQIGRAISFGDIEVIRPAEDGEE